MDVPGRRVAVLGSMLELGERSAAIHRETLSELLHTDLDRIIVTGAFAQAAEGLADDRIDAVADPGELARRLPRLIESGDAVLLKASRGVRLERLIPVIESSFGKKGD